MSAEILFDPWNEVQRHGQDLVDRLSEGSRLVGRSKWSGNIGKSGVVFRVDTPVSGVGRASYSIQINSGIEY
ncbi:hypothetical protein QQ045_027316 [Rhodiola kirilowii]